MGKIKGKYEGTIKKRDKVIKRTINYRWVISVTLIAFLITIFCSLGSETLVRNVNIGFGLLIVAFFILAGVIFDMIGIAVTSAEEKPFHSMSARRVKGAKTAVKMLKHAEKVSAFCNDVIGDICNIMSGSAGIVIASSLNYQYQFDITLTTLIITSVIAATTIGGKAIGKSIAINKSEVILYKFAKVCSILYK